MRILFATDAHDRVSTLLNAPNYARLGDIDGVHIDFYNHNYAEYDVVLFMGYDPHVSEARKIKPELKIGVIDPRPTMVNTILNADFVIANGLEMQDWLSEYFTKIFIYPIYPYLKASPKEHQEHKPLIIGYHGNKVHLLASKPHVTGALDALAEEYPFEFWAIYDIRSLGKIPFNLFSSKKIKVRFIQWEEDVYEKVLSQVDIGIVPNLIPLIDEAKVKEQVKALFPSLLQPHETDYLFRFKNTTNPGRIYVFSQLGIPVVAGMAPSAAQAIQHGVSGYLAVGTGAWYGALRRLANSPELRSEMGKRLYIDFCTHRNPEVLNRKLFDFINTLESNRLSEGVERDIG